MRKNLVRLTQPVFWTHSSVRNQAYPYRGKAKHEKSKTDNATDEKKQIFWNKQIYGDSDDPATSASIRKQCMVAVNQFGPHSVTYLNEEDLVWFPVTCMESGQTTLLGCL